MTSLYSSNLLQQPVDTARAGSAPAPQAPAPARSVTHVVAQPQPMYVPVAQPQPIYAPPAPRGGGALGAIALALVVILVGAAALVGGYYATTQSAITDHEAAVVQNISARDGFRNGRERGIDAGRQQALEFASTTTAMRASIARQNAYNAAFRRGERAGRNSYRAPRYTGSGYRAPRFGGTRGYEVAAAFGQAQNLANLTGAPVDVEIY